MELSLFEKCSINIKNSDEYGELAKEMLGNDKVTKKECSILAKTKYDEINKIIDEINEKDAISLQDGLLVFNKIKNFIEKPQASYI